MDASITQQSSTQLVQAAFGDRKRLFVHVTATLKAQPQLQGLFIDICHYVNELKTQNASNGVHDPSSPAAKRRKLNENKSTNTAATSSVDTAKGTSNAAAGAASDLLTATWQAPSVDVSFSVPQRKKYSLQISAKANEGIRALNPSSKTPEFGIPWKSVENVLRLPVPEKTTASHNFCVFPKGGDGFSGDGGDGSNGGSGAGGFETIVWSASDARKKGEGEETPTESGLIKQVLSMSGVKVVEPNEEEFVSVYKNPMRKTESQYHVKAFRGSKEGYLFFLPTGIAFVFKKPLLFFSFASIQSISYTSVLQRTFNLNISAMPASAPSSDLQPIEMEFSMLDQADFPAIDAYVKRHELNDASMAETRRAKRYNVNKDQPTTNDGSADGGDGDGIGEDGEEGETELSKAEKEAREIAGSRGKGGGGGGFDDDDDEEDDENFDPGSEGESEGEVSTSEEEDNDGDGGHEDGMDED